MKGLLMKDLLVIQKKYGITRIIMDIFIIVALMLFLKGTGAIYISLLLIPVEIMTMIISLTTCDEQWKWGKYVVALPVSKTTIVKSRYIVALIMTCIGFGVALLVNTITYFIFPQFAFGYVVVSYTGTGFLSFFAIYFANSHLYPLVYTHFASGMYLHRYITTFIGGQRGVENYLGNIRRFVTLSQHLQFYAVYCPNSLV